MHYYQRHIGDYTKDTSHLTLLEHGVYCRLIDIYCANEKPISNKQKYRCIGARTKDEKEAVDNVLNDFFKLDEDNWTQKKCEEVIQDYRKKGNTSRVNGSKGGRPPKPRDNPEETQ